MKKLVLALVACLMLAEPAWATIARVQTTKGGQTGAVTSITTANFGSSVTSGNLITVFFRVTPSAESVNSVTDTLGSTYTFRASDTTQDPHLYCYDTKLASSGTNAVTVSLTAGSYMWVFAIEISGQAASPLDLTNATHGAATTDLTSSAVTTAQNVEYVAMAGGQNAFQNYTAANDSAGNTWTLVDGQIGGSGNNFGGVEEFVTSSTLSTDTFHLTSNGSAQFTTVWIAYKDSGGGGGGAKSPAPFPCLLLGVGCE